MKEKIININHYLHDDKVVSDYSELPLWSRLRMALALILGRKIVIFGKLNITKHLTKRIKKLSKR